MANGPGEGDLAHGEAQVQRYLQADGFAKDEIEQDPRSGR